jgi:hypothetical protein
MAIDFLMMRGSRGAAVKELKAALAAELGAEAAAFPGLARSGDELDADTEAALRRWQAGTGMIADGIAGPHGLRVLYRREPAAMEIKPELAALRMLFPQTKPSNIVRYLPYVTDALGALGLTDRTMVLAALATIRAETAGFLPISEYPSQANTLPGQPPFSKYEPGTEWGERFGNRQQGDGAKFRGRGFVQLRGADHYHRYTIATGIDMAARPDLANAPEVAAVLLAMFLAARADELRGALDAAQQGGDFGAARRLVNGHENGTDDFQRVFETAAEVWPATATAPLRRGATRSAARSEPPVVVRSRATRKDPPDLRDRLYQPAPIVLPEMCPSPSDASKHLKNYRQLVLDQGSDYSCTGYGLACVINFARWQKSDWQPDLPSVSARMLYNYARRYDEYAGEDYDGSSCRGALKGWFNHGVCLLDDWPDHEPPRFGYAERALQTTLGVYYRIDIQSITDMQAAIVQAHAIFVSAFTHDGWVALEHAEASAEVPTHDNLPLIEFDGRASKADGHAFALVGFNRRGFIVQNSWGGRFGLGGFAVLSYEDWLLNGMDAWVASLGVPGVVQGRLADGSGGPARTARAAATAQWWDDGIAYQHSIVLGNDGRVNRYLTQDELTRTLLYQACALPDRWFRTDPVAARSQRKRLVIYAHGGLNSEPDAIARARAMGRFFTGNGCYPLFLVWKTGLLESLGDVVEDAVSAAPRRVGGVFDAIIDKTDLLIEKTLGRGPGRMVWSEMKENARFACTTNRACDLLAMALQNLATTWGDDLEIHLVGHSAGSIILGHMLEVLWPRGLEDRIAGVHLFAPACTVQFANRYYAPHQELMQRLWLSILSDAQERDDNVFGLYRKSLLYLVSNALEPDLRTPLLGMENVWNPEYAGWDGSSTTAEALGTWHEAAREAGLAQRTTLVVAPRVPVLIGPSGQVKTVSAAHGSFDNNIDIVSATLERITGEPLALPVDDLVGY